MRKRIACFALFALLAHVQSLHAAEQPATEGAEIGVWTMDIDAARALAAEKHLPLLLNFTGSDWCSWCKLMDKSVFSQEAWQAYAKENLVLVWLDFPKNKALVPEPFVARNKALAAQFGVRGYPTYMVLDEDGESLLGRLGAARDSTPERFIGQVKGLLVNSAAAVKALLDSLPEESATVYRAAAKALEDARAEQKVLKEEYDKRSAELGERIAADEKRLVALRTEARLAQFPPEKAEAYKAMQARHEELKAQIEAWLATKPERNDENTAKHKAWSEELSALEQGMQSALEGD